MPTSYASASSLPFTKATNGSNMREISGCRTENSRTFGGGEEFVGDIGDVVVQVARRTLVVARLGARPERRRDDDFGVVRHDVQQVRDAVEARPALVVGLDDVPRRFGDIGVDEHLVFGFRVVDPTR